MASLIQHMADCTRLVGEPCEDVNRWIDFFFAEFGPYHRFKRHHREGVQQAESLFGERGRRAAVVHILRDCRNIPRRRDYEDGTVDKLGLIAKWPVTAYIRFPDDAFERLAMFSLNGPEAVYNLGFIKSHDDLQRLLMTQSPAEDASQREGVLEKWPSSVLAQSKLPSLPEAILEPLSELQTPYADELSKHPLILSLRQQFSSVSIHRVEPRFLINPLVWLDLEYVEQLRAELTDKDDLGAIKVAIPTDLHVSARVALDADGRGVTVISPQQSVAVTPPIIGQLPGVGMSVTFNVIGTPQLILASRVSGRLYLRNGMHRAYLLSSVGIQLIPVVVVDETVLSPIMTAYPAFNLETLESDRPPVIADMFNEDLITRVQILRTKKVARIRVDETMIPID